MRYYSTQRPVMPGSFPKPEGNRVTGVVGFDRREQVESIGRPAWGYIEYEKPLSDRDAEAYELVPEGGAKL